MTGPEIEKAHDLIRTNVADPEIKELLHYVLDIRSYMISCLAYGEDYYQSINDEHYRGLFSESNAQKLERLGARDGAIEEGLMWQEMKKDFAEYGNVQHDVYMDTEGLCYNAVEWMKPRIDAKFDVATKWGTLVVEVSDDRTGPFCTHMYSVPRTISDIEQDDLVARPVLRVQRPNS